MTELARLVQNLVNPFWTDGLPVETISEVDLNAKTVRKPMPILKEIPDYLQRAIDEGRAREVSIPGLGGSDPMRPFVGVKDAQAVAKKSKVELIEASFDPAGPTWVVPLETKSEVNLTEWRKRSKRSNAAWRAVSLAMGPRLAALVPFVAQYHALKRPIIVRMTRLGGRKLDRGNLPSALKGTEDAVAFMMGASDGDPRWVSQFEQEPGGPMGVRITLEIPK